MVNIRRILVPIDFSDASREALRHAAAFAQWYDARLVALHVVTPMLVPAPMMSSEASAAALLPAGYDINEVAQDVRRFVRKAGIDPDPVQVITEEGDPVQRILSHVSPFQEEMVVMGTHGRGGFDHMVLGSVAEKILRKAGCPVLTVPPSTVRASTFPLKRLLCPVDFSPASRAALQFALSIAQECDARITLLHVVEWPAIDEDPLVEVAPGIRDIRKKLEAQASEQLQRLMADDVEKWCEPSTRIEHGKPYERILATAAAEDADLIIMGVAGRSRLNLALFGSTTNHVVRRAACPVLTLRH